MANLEERSTVLTDVNKQIMTLASGILAVVATFVTGIIGTSPATLHLAALGGAALLLLVSICCALVGHAKILDYLKEASATTVDPARVKRAWNRSAFIANLGFFLFALSLAFLLAFACLRLTEKPRDVAAAAIRSSVDLLTERGKIKSADEWSSFTTIRKQDGDEYEVRFKSAAGVEYACTVAVATGKLTGCR